MVNGIWVAGAVVVGRNLFRHLGRGMAERVPPYGSPSAAARPTAAPDRPTRHPCNFAMPRASATLRSARGKTRIFAMRLIAAIAVVGLIAAIAQPASADMADDCEQSRDQDLSIGGCTAVIRSGEFSGRNLAIAYSNRGSAYYNLGENRRAIEDFDQALRIDPGFAIAYSNRGLAYNNLGEHRRAIEDYDQAIRIDPGLAAAYNNRGDDTFESQSWMIKGSTSRNLDTPPFGGQEGIRLDALYPIEGGVAAMVTDFNLEAEQAAAFRWDFRPMVTLDGIVWFAEALLGVPPNSAIGSLAWAVCAEAVLFVLLFFGEVGLGMVFSTDGSNWGVADQTLDIPLLAGEPLQVQVTGETTFHVYSSADRSYRQYSVEYGPSGDALIEPIFESGVPELGENQVAVPRFLEEQQACDDQLVFPPMGVLLDTLFPRLPTGD